MCARAGVMLARCVQTDPWLIQAKLHSHISWNISTCTFSYSSNILHAILVRSVSLFSRYDLMILVAKVNCLADIIVTRISTAPCLPRSLKQIQKLFCKVNQSFQPKR